MNHERPLNNPYDEVSKRRGVGGLLLDYEGRAQAGKWEASKKALHGIVRRKPDLLRVKYVGNKIVEAEQAELQSFLQFEMEVRMLEYHGVMRRILGVAPRQYVFYFGEAPLTMKNVYETDFVRFEYILRDVREYPAAYFIAQNTPNALFLAFLCGYEGTAEEHVRSILSALLNLGLPPDELAELLDDLETISKLRTLEGNLLNEMMSKERYLLHYPELKDTYLFSSGKAEGKAEGLRIAALALAKEGDNARRIALLLNLPQEQVELWLKEDAE